MEASGKVQMPASIARRDFIAALGGAALMPVSVRAQQRTMPVVGFLGLTTPESFANQVAAFHRGLGEAGYVEGQNVAVEYRWAHTQFEKLPSLALELVRRQVSVIAAVGTPASALAAKATTTTIPVVFVTGGDPVRLGLVQSLNRPDGNATGVYMFTTELEPKRLELLHELVPSAAVIAVLVDPNSPETEVQMKDLSAAALALKRKIIFLNAGSESEIEAAFAAAAEQRAGGLLITSAPFFLPRREKFVALAARYALPTAYFFCDFAAAGGLMSYGTSLSDAYRLAGLYTGRILKGEKTSDLPVQQSVKVELVINLKTAKTLGLTFPLTLLGRADEVIE